MKYLLIAEKPSLMNSIRDCYKNHKSEVVGKLGEIDFIALAGHVCGNWSPDDYEEWKDVNWHDVEYPMIPAKWKVKAIPDARKKEIIRNIKDKIKSGEYDGLINACDSDQEGYGIFALLMDYIGNPKIRKLRFMEHSLTDGEILKSLLSMTDLEKTDSHVNFVNSFYLRSRADWLYGMNLTRMMTIRSPQTMTVGRVKAPTIKLVYDNSMAIENFKARKYFTLEAKYDTFSGVYVDEEKKPVQFETVDKIPNPPLQGVVRECETQLSKTHAPKLYDLTSIQSEAGQQYGYKPAETLAIIQSLYEKHKVISYPRTQCQYVSEEKAKEFPAMLKLMDVFPELAPFAKAVSQADIDRVFKDKQVVNDKEVQKESHDALLPTDKRPNPAEMSEAEQKICVMIYKRLLAQFLPQLAENKTTLLIAHGDCNFLAKGKSVVEQGWKKLYKEGKDSVVPSLEKGEPITAKSMDKAEKETTPPKRLTQATLIAAMKNIASQIDDPELKKSLNDSQGIGTPATRATIITDIISRGYVDDKKGGLFITRLGKNYIESMKDIDIVSPVFAAQMDTEIKKIQRGEATYDEVYRTVVDDLKKVCGQVEGIKGIGAETELICRNCGSRLVDGRYAYACPNCDFKVQKEVCGHKLSEDDVRKLLDGKVIGPYSMKKKDGTKFSARLKVDAGGVEFDFGSGLKCPKCGKETVKVNKGGAFCDCGLQIFRKVAGHELTDAELKKLLFKKSVTGIDDFTSKAGNKFQADIVLNDEFKTELKFN